MDRIKYLLVLMLLAGPVVAADYQNSLQEMSAVVKQNLRFATNSAATPDSLVYRSIRSASIVIANTAYGIFLADTIEAAANDHDYALDTLMIKVIDVLWLHIDSTKTLKYAPKSQWGSLYSRPIQLSARTGYERHPDYYDWHNGFIFFYGTPVEADSFVVYGFAKVANIMSDTSFITDFPVTYRPVIEALATAYTAAKLKMYSDFEAWWGIFEKNLAFTNATINAREDQLAGS